MKSDHQWLGQLWNSNAGFVRAYLQRRVEGEAVDDLLSEVFVVAWRHRDRKPASALPWLYGIARKVVSTHYRGRSRRSNLDMKLASLPASPPDTIAQADIRSAIGDALDQMDSSDREILLLFAWEGLAPREIAVALGVSSATIRMRLSRARTRFKKALEIQNSPNAPIEKEQM